jgi:hypothetical protein
MDNGSPAAFAMAAGVVTERTAGVGGRGTNKNQIRKQTIFTSRDFLLQHDLPLAPEHKKGRPGEGHPVLHVRPGCQSQQTSQFSEQA